MLGIFLSYQASHRGHRSPSPRFSYVILPMFAFNYVTFQKRVSLSNANNIARRVFDFLFCSSFLPPICVARIPMPVVQPPADGLRPSDLTYTHAYNSIVSRVRRTAGAASGGVVILAGVDVVSKRRNDHIVLTNPLGWTLGCKDIMFIVQK